MKTLFRGNLTIYQVALIISCLYCTAHSQNGFQRRSSLNSLSKVARVDLGSPMYVGPTRANEYFDNYGEWKFDAGFGYAFDSNAFQDDTNQSDSLFSQELSLSYEWWADQSKGLVLEPILGLESMRFDELDELDGDFVSSGLILVIKDQKLPFETQIQLVKGWGFIDSFSEIDYEEWNSGVEIGDTLIGGEDESSAVLGWKIGANVISTSPNIDSFVSGSFALELEAPLTDRVKFAAGTGISYADYFDSPTDRSQWIAQSELEIALELSKYAELVGGIAYQHGEDSDPGLDYDQVVFMVGLSFALEDFRFLGLPPKDHHQDK